MAVANVSFPTFILSCPGEAAMLFSTWTQIENYLLAFDATENALPGWKTESCTASLPQRRGTMDILLIV